MSDEQIKAAARLWRQGMDTLSIAKVLFGWATGYRAEINYEAVVYNHIGRIRAHAG